jgi:hypothetical protein
MNDEGNSGELNDAFTGSLTYQPAVPSGDLVVQLSKTEYKNPGTEFNDVTFVDFTVGLELTFRVEYTSKNFLQSFFVVSPSGDLYDNLIFGNDTKAPTAFIKIPGIAEDGVWNYTLTVASSPNDRANVIVTSKSKSDSGPITVDCFVPGENVISATITNVKIVAVVMQQNNPVIGAEVR